MVEATVQILEYTRTFNGGNEFFMCDKSMASQFFLKPREQVVVAQHEIRRVWRVLEHFLSEVLKQELDQMSSMRFDVVTEKTQFP